MADFGVEIEPDVAGFDPRRLDAVGRYAQLLVDSAMLPGALVAVSRGGRVVHLSTHGFRDDAGTVPVTPDTVWRWYSMNKPIVAAAAMLLHDRGVFGLDTPIAEFLPEFGTPRVFTGGTAAAATTRAAREPIRIWHLLTHTAGLTYGFHHAHPVDELYRSAGFEVGHPRGLDLAACCSLLATLPLQAEPGTRWIYSIGLDVMARVIEVAVGRPIREFLRSELLDPLGMTDAGFDLRPESDERLATLQTTDGATGRLRPDPSRAETFARMQGPGGMGGTAADYHRFVRLLVGRGEIDGFRLLGPRTVTCMMSNHLPGGADIETIGHRLYPDTSYAGTGFGLGAAVVIDPVTTKIPGSAGEYFWGGAATTHFWVDPAEEIGVLMFAQALTRGRYPIRKRLHQLVYQALVP